MRTQAGDWKRLPGWSLLCGALVQGSLFGAAMWLKSETLMRVLLWNAYLLALLAGPGPSLGLDPSGHEMHEGTPVHLLFAVIGLCAGVALYAVVAYFVLRAIRSTTHTP